MPHRVLLLASKLGYQTRVFDAAARKLGVDLVMATDRCHVLEDPWGDRAIAVRFEDPDAAAEELAGLQPRPDGVVAVGDRPTELAAAVARRLGIRYNSPQSTATCRNKYLARERFRAAGLLVPRFYRIPLDADVSSAALEAAYPCVLKPLGLSASRGVIRADNPTEFASAFQRIRAILRSPEIVRLHESQDRFIQVESFIEGREIALEGFVTDGLLQALAIFDKPDPLNGPYFEETIYITPSREPVEMQQEIIRTTQLAINATGLTNGPLHAEMRVNDRGVWLLELAARPIGGLCAQALRFTNGEGLEEAVLRHALGEDISSVRREDAASGVMMIPIPKNGVYAGVSGVGEAEATPLITGVEVTAKEGQKLLKLPEGNSYLGFIFARAGWPQHVEAALREAHSKLRFEISTELPVLERKA